MPVDPADLIEFLEKQAPRPLSIVEITDHFQVPRRARKAAAQLLAAMAGEGTLVRLKGDRYSLPRKVNLATGTVSVHRDGFGFLSRPPAEGGDIFIPARYLREVMDGDRVVVRIERGWRGAGPEGRVIRILERAHRTLVGLYESSRRFGYVVPADPRVGYDLFIPEGASQGARDGQVVLARIDAYPGKTRNPEGTILEILGEPDDPEVEILAIAHKHDLPHRFPEEVLAAAAAVPGEVRAEDLQGRQDLRQLPFVTIDGETAKDFDDAVAVRREKGGIRLWVAIADVAHYVPEGSAIDEEALERGTSVYFPGRALPMLPERLSNGICSLNPAVDRLVMTAEMLFDGEGQRLESRFFPAVINSRARLTYTEVRDMLETAAPEVIDHYSNIFPDLELMKDLALRLMAMRRRRGSLDFDLPEAEVVLDLRGRPENIIRTERSVAHRMIEEFMLAANESVALFLGERQAPILYRVHEPPDLEKLQAFQEFAAHFNIGTVLDPTDIDPRRLQEILAALEGRPEERMLNQVLLRSMKQARYAAANVGHFGLAAEHYCHFTSPIRRYPDLVVHRVLGEVLRSRGRLPEGRRGALQRLLPGLGEHTSQRERRAMEAEREVISLKKCQFMVEKVGEEFPGWVSGVQPFGFFVEIKDYFVEGLVHISSLADDYYHYEEDLHRLVGENRRRIFQVGAEVRVTVEKVDLARREIDFKLAGEEAPERQGTRRKVQGGRRKAGRRKAEDRGRRTEDRGPRTED